MKKVKESWIIHGFALLHAAVAFLCRQRGSEDELLLTVLTMTMVLILCLKKKLNIELTATSIIIVNIIGYLMGNVGAQFFSTMFDRETFAHACATAVTTEILGWSLTMFARIFSKGSKGDGQQAAPYLSWLILAMLLIFILRLCVSLVLSGSNMDSEDVLGVMSKIFSNTFALIILICLNIIYVWAVRRWLKSRSRFMKVLILTLFTACSTLLEVGMTRDSDSLLPLCIAALIAQITIYCIVYMANYAFTVRYKMEKAKEKAHSAQYRYQILKRQVNPHFLFNSLNVLDCLVCEEKTELASTYIHKLAGIYRYMIKSEDEQLVPLSEELAFVEKYIDLMKVRFPEGFEVNVTVDRTLEKMLILSCSIQLLIENAIKHNVIDIARPLVIDVVVQDGKVKVTNNVIPKLTKAPSTGLGQKYIRKQYMDLCGKAIDIAGNEKEYSVVLPLI